MLRNRMLAMLALLSFRSGRWGIKAHPVEKFSERSTTPRPLIRKVRE
jgi:hypothetical protein